MKLGSRWFSILCFAVVRGLFGKFKAVCFGQKERKTTLENLKEAERKSKHRYSNFVFLMFMNTVHENGILLHWSERRWEGSERVRDTWQCPEQAWLGSTEPNLRYVFFNILHFYSHFSEFGWCSNMKQFFII